MYRVWYSTETFANYIIANTKLSEEPEVVKEKLCESDANNHRRFHQIPDHIRKILYLDAPDLIIEKDDEPVLSIEETKEAGTGHNAFQRFARIAAAVENGVPAFYIYPQGVIINRSGNIRWDSINPAVFMALEATMDIYSIPAFLFYYPSDYSVYHRNPADSPRRTNKGLKHDGTYLNCPDARGESMQTMFALINEVLQELAVCNVKDVQRKLLQRLSFREWKSKMQREFCALAGNRTVHEMSPLTATRQIPTSYLMNYLSQYECNDYQIGALLRGRAETIVYQVDAKFRGDPYPGALAAIDYVLCREGQTFEDRRYNLVLAFGEVIRKDAEQTIEVSSGEASINDFCGAVNSSAVHNLLTKSYADLKAYEIPRYFMQVRYGSMYSKQKHIRVFSYFADAILFSDGALWRDA